MTEIIGIKRGGIQTEDPHLTCSWPGLGKRHEAPRKKGSESKKTSVGEEKNATKKTQGDGQVSGLRSLR